MKNNDKIINAYLKIINESYEMTDADASNINLSVDGTDEMSKAQDSIDAGREARRKAVEDAKKVIEADKKASAKRYAKEAEKAKKEAEKAEERELEAKAEADEEESKKYRICCMWVDENEKPTQDPDPHTFEDFDELYDFAEKYKKRPERGCNSWIDLNPKNISKDYIDTMTKYPAVRQINTSGRGFDNRVVASFWIEQHLKDFPTSSDSKDCPILDYVIEKYNNWGWETTIYLSNYARLKMWAEKK